MSSISSTITDLVFLFSFATYVPQLLILAKSSSPSVLPLKTSAPAPKSSKSGFDPRICRVLLLCHVCRLLSSVLGQPLNKNIVYQSIGMLLVQSATVYYSSKNRSAPITEYKRDLVAATTSLSRTSRSLVIFTVAVLALTIVTDIVLVEDIVFLKEMWFGFHPLQLLPSSLLTFSLALESLPPLLQLLAIRKNNSSEGVSKVMVGGWLVGDLGKVFYFQVKGEPKMLLGAVLCALIDAAVVWEVEKQHDHDR
ncbi:hypothetical protein TrVE_jg6261 [Triparma verrucosa]|uniref:PQ-loop repeat-containing protein 1 n=1 Tax=Triparma verrucosa TaxID=1606542 RepID=A0A9W7BEU9_9STRA|nr:hypothetical protein TrVE_jg6261 [Triparma verrucosa]